MDQANFAGDKIGYINFAPFLIRTTVIDAHYLKLTVAGVDHADDGAKGKVGVCGRKGFGVEALAIGGLAAIKPGAIPTGIAYPGLDRLHGLIQVGDEGCFHALSEQEHEENPSQCSPAHEKSMSHSVFFVLLGSRKV